MGSRKYVGTKEGGIPMLRGLAEALGQRWPVAGPLVVLAVALMLLLSGCGSPDD